MEQKKRNVTKEEKIIRLLQYLKEYTDENHPASIPMIERYFSEHYWRGYFGDKNTRKNMIKEMVRVINSNEDGNLLPREEWSVVYDDFVRDNITEPDVVHAEHHICNIYYCHPFKKDDVRTILNSILANQMLTEEERDRLILRVKKVFTSREFFDRPLSPDERTKEARDRRRLEHLLDDFIKRKAMWAESDWY